MRNSAHRAAHTLEPLVRWALVFPFALYGAWTGVWLMERSLESRVVWLTMPAGQFVYWLVAKILLWLVPAALIIRLSGRNLGEMMGLGHLLCRLSWPKSS